jgi:hypothetical protein
LKFVFLQSGTAIEKLDEMENHSEEVDFHEPYPPFRSWIIGTASAKSPRKRKPSRSNKRM